MMKFTMPVLIAITFASCVSVSMSLPSDFTDASTRLRVKGLNGVTLNQKLSFGDYQTSKVRRGWHFNSSVQYTKFRVSPEEMILQVFDIRTDHRKEQDRQRFQYTLRDNKLMTEIYATEKFQERQLVYKSNNPWIGEVHQTRRYDYAFTAAIVPVAAKPGKTWSLVLMSRYDRAKDTARRIFDRPYVEEEGYATNGTETIAIAPLRLETLRTADSRHRKVLGGPLLSGYELSINNEVIAAIDLLDNAVWMHEQLNRETKIMVASIASAVLLRQVKEPEAAS